MSAPNVKDLATALVVTAPSPADSGTTFTVEAGKGSRFPAVPFKGIVHPEGTLPTIDTGEIVNVTALSTDTFTVTRAQGVTPTAKSVAIGWRFSAAVFAEHVEEAYERENHTGSQAISTVTNLQTTLDGKVSKTASSLSDVTWVQTNPLATPSNDKVLSHTALSLLFNGLLNRANHTGTQLASTISDFDTEVSNNTDVAANTAARHTHANQAVLDATTASFTTADETKLDGIEAGAEVNDVDSVNGQTGTVVLNAGHVGADPAGSAASAVASANSYTDSQIQILENNDMFKNFQENNVDETDTITYTGYCEPNGEVWLIKRVEEVGDDFEVTYANVSNNPSKTTYASAWTDHLTIDYDLIGELTI